MDNNTINFFNIVAKNPDMTINEIIYLGKFMNIESKYLLYFIK